MTVSELIETLERLKEYDPEVEIVIRNEDGYLFSNVGPVILFDGKITIYGEEE